MKDIVRQWANVLATVTTIVVNALANALPFNGQTTAAISDRFAVYFVPAGYVFSVWGAIYVGMIAYSAYQALPSQRANPRLRRIGYIYLLTCAANCGWLFLWHYEQFVWTLVAMGILLVALIAIYRSLHTGESRIGAAERWAVVVPFSIYLGWITVATIANVTDVLYYLHWDGWGVSGQAWAVTMLAVGGLIAGAVSLPRRDTAYMLVILWAFVGIAVRQSAAPVVAGAALGVAAALALLMLARALRPSGRSIALR